MKGWSETTLKKVAKKVDYGYTASATQTDTGVRFLRITDIVPSSIEWNTVPFCEISEGEFEKSKLSHGDIVIARTGATVGYAKQIGCNAPNAVFASYLVRVKLKDDVSEKFVGLLVESNNYKNYINTIAGGSAQPNANAQDLSSYPFYLPPKLIQEKIAAILSAYDDLIENNRRRIALLEKMAEEIYREWFVRMRFPGHEQAKFDKGVPARWRELASSDVFDVLSGGTPKTDVAAYWDGEIPFFTPKDAGDNFYVLDTDKHITANGLNSCNSRLYPKETIFITARGTVGKLALANRAMAMNQSCYALAPKMAGPAFFHFMAIKGAINYLKGVSKSGVFDNIIVDTFKTVPILMPADDQIKHFNQVVGPMFHQVSRLMEVNALLAGTRDKFLPRLISGKLLVEFLDIRFPPSMEEPAHAI